MATKEETHYVLILQVEKVTKIVKETPSGSRWDETKREEIRSDVTEVAKVVIKCKGMPELKEKGTQHLILVEDDI